MGIVISNPNMDLDVSLMSKPGGRWQSQIQNWTEKQTHAFLSDAG